MRRTDRILTAVTIIAALVVVTFQSTAVPRAYAQTTTTPPPTQESAMTTIIDRPTAARLAAQDPYFASFEAMLKQCNDMALYGNSSITMQQCEITAQQGADRWCGLEFYDAKKCEYASVIALAFGRVNSILGGTDLSQILPGGALGLTENLP